MPQVKVGNISIGDNAPLVLISGPCVSATEVPVLTHAPPASAPPMVAEVWDVIQIPVFLCRQTDIAVAAGKSGKPINLKKGQFIAPEDMGVLAGKIKSTGNNQIMLTERGVVFGYSNLVVDMRSLVKMRELGYPVVFDVSHSIQMPTANTSVKRGEPEYILPLARAGVAFWWCAFC